MQQQKQSISKLYDSCIYPWFFALFMKYLKGEAVKYKKDST